MNVKKLFQSGKTFFQFKNKLIKETYSLKRFMHKNNICLGCDIETLS